MLTGDSNAAAQKVGKKLGIDEIYSQLLPADKVNQMERLISEKSEKGTLVFVGEGLRNWSKIYGCCLFY